MKGDAEVLGALDGLVSAELAARDQWLLYARIAANWGLHGLAARLTAESAEEAGHARALIDRMVFLETVPAMTVPEVRGTDDLAEMFAHSLELELGAVADYRAAIELCGATDPTSRTLCERHLADEEGHVNWLEEQVYLLEKMGEAAYLQTLVRGDGA